MGAGKTALAQRLAATFGYELLLERAAQNPFLPKFYRDKSAVALASQLYFLLEHLRQARALRQTDLFDTGHVADFLIETDRLFAEATLNADELALYHQIYDNLVIDPPAPDLVIYLQASVDVLSRRVRTYGTDYEKKTEPEYLRKIADAYTDFFYHYDASPLLIINAAELDFSAAHDDLAVLPDYLRGLGPGRHYFNPREL